MAIFDSLFHNNKHNFKNKPKVKTYQQKVKKFNTSKSVHSIERLMKESNKRFKTMQAKKSKESKLWLNLLKFRSVLVNSANNSPNNTSPGIIRIKNTLQQYNCKYEMFEFWTGTGSSIYQCTDLQTYLHDRQLAYNNLK